MKLNKAMFLGTVLALGMPLLSVASPIDAPDSKHLMTVNATGQVDYSYSLKEVRLYAKEHPLVEYSVIHRNSDCVKISLRCKNGSKTKSTICGENAEERAKVLIDTTCGSSKSAGSEALNRKNVKGV